MKLCAINRSTGKIVLSHNGNLTEEQFRNTVKLLNPSIKREDILLIIDGKLEGTTFPNIPTNKNLKPVIWKGSFTDLGGYANMNREIATRLVKHGFSIKADILKTVIQVDPLTNIYLEALADNKIPNQDSCPMVIGFLPMPVAQGKRKYIFYTMMETQGLHKSFVDRCNQGAYEVWVPCEFYKKVFEESGIVKPIRVIPLGVDQSIYTPEAKPTEVIYEDILSQTKTTLLPDKAVKYMSLFGWSHRKGPDVLCKSFIREFSAKDNVVLAIFSRYMGSSSESNKKHIRDEILKYYEEEGKKDPPPIYYCGDEIPIPSLPGCYSQMDVFVFCSRGEGFALPVIEAGACGLSVVSTYDTSMTQYLDNDVSYLVVPAKQAPANEKLAFISEYYRDQLFSEFDESNIIQFGTHMRHIYEYPELAQGKADKFRERILREYTWDVCVRRVAERLEELI